MPDYILLAMKSILAFLGILTAVYLARLDKQFPDAPPTSTYIYILIGGYIVFVFAWPDAVSDALKTVSKKVSSLSIKTK